MRGVNESKTTAHRLANKRKEVMGSGRMMYVVSKKEKSHWAKYHVAQVGYS